MLDFARCLGLASALRYALWRARGRAEPVVLSTRTGARFELRAGSTGPGANTDYGVAYEVFALDLYRPAARLEPGAVRFVVDVGANVGFSVIHWLMRFPGAEVLAFEPHPAHAAQARRNLALNAGGGRATLVEAGAGASARTLLLSDQGSSSRVLGEGEGEGLSVRLVDLFPMLGGRRVDLLKLDCEGGEYELLADDRFAELDVRAIVMEWHQR
ncbi:MAG: FkbM family methyltransferase, partial [Rubritepida sp.]|nr:FkbM family methyltransferase [Rubritepida sp.]